MQIQHEAQLIDGLASTLSPQDFGPKPNRTLETYTLTQTTINATEHLVSSPVGSQIAAYLANTNQILIIDTRNPSRRERFPLKSCDRKFSKHSFTLKGIDFSPDGTRLAVGQTDCIIYIYKLSNGPSTNGNIVEQALKLTITGKFVCSSPVTCLLWTDVGIVFGTQDGKVRLISILSKSTTEGQSSSTAAKVGTIFGSTRGSAPISLAYKSPILAIGYLDGSIVSMTLNASETNLNTDAGLDQSTARRSSSQPPSTSISHTCPPYYLKFLPNMVLCCAGSDGRIAFHLIQNEHVKDHYKIDSSLNNYTQKSPGDALQNIDLKDDLVALDYSSINEVLAIATSTKLLFIKYDQESRNWQLQSSHIELKNMLTLTSVLWMRDGSQLVVATLIGSLELFGCSWSKQSVGEELDICHIAKNRVRVTDRARNLLATYKTQYDIKKVNLLDHGQNVVIWTTNSLLLARLGCWQQSEIPWGRIGKGVKFCFENPGFVLVYSATNQQLILVKLGQDEIVYSLKMETTRKSTLSVRQYPTNVQNYYQSTNKGSLLEIDKQRSPSSARSRIPSIALPEDASLTHSEQSASAQESLKERFALVAEAYQLVVVDLKTKTRELSKRHSEPIVWLELSYTSNSLVFRDTQNKLYLIALKDSTEDHQFQLLLENCEFAKWFPESDILIAQSSSTISIWYNIDELNKTFVIDSRSFNINQTAPIIDLSFASQQSMKPYPTIVKISTNYQIILSNGQTLPLDRIKVRFFTELVARRLSSAFDVLERESSVKLKSGSNLDLWSRLGWLAVEQVDLQVAIKVFQKLKHSNMVKYLEICLEKPDERDWRLALIRGDWDTFERIAEPQQIVSTYRRLNRWTQLIEYLNRKQQFRQRDLVELEYRQWLLDKGRHLEGAKIQARNGDLLGAVELLLNNQKLIEAANLFIEEQKVSLARSRDRSLTQLDKDLLELARRLKSSLLAGGHFQLAGVMCDKILEEQSEAIDLYLQGEAFESALEVSRTVARDRVQQIEETYGEYLMREYRLNKRSRKQTQGALERFLAAGKPTRALEAALELKNHQKAFEILQLFRQSERKFDEETLRIVRDSSSRVAESMLREGDKEKAIDALVIGEQFERVVDLYIEMGDFKRAHETSLSRINNRDRDKTNNQFIELAKQMISTNGRLDEAEKIYLLVERPDLAIDMHKDGKSFDRMLELVAEFSPDALEATLLKLARELESQGQFGAAEKYLLRASPAEWTNVVRMYRLVGQWSEAYRVAKANCSSERDPLLVQLAYWWAKSLGKAEAAHELLQQLNAVQPVIEFCCENKNYPFALELSQCDPDVPRRRDIVRRYAAHLEEQHKFDRAEEILVRFRLVEEAARMYLDNDQHLEAIRVVESQLALGQNNNSKQDDGDDAADDAQLVDLLNQILVECADRLVAGLTLKQQLTSDQLSAETSGRLLAAQQMYLRAQRPELAVNMYKDRGLWKEAVQVAQRFAPQLLETVENALDTEVVQDVKPIVAQLHSERLREQSSNSLKAQNVVGRQQVADRNGSDFLKSQAETSMRNGDLNGTKTALGKFLDSLIDGDKA